MNSSANRAPDVRNATWFDRDAYPFESRYLELPSGRMHYLDEGRGRALVFVHGSPSWSWDFRKLIRGLRGRFRCIAPDHVGFGLSDRDGADLSDGAHGEPAPTPERARN
jgi:pimeloyl-ACP methyl ester carboxylesterase